MTADEPAAAGPCIWVDADACPRVVREILYRAAQRTGVQVNFVANQPIALPRSPHLRMRVVESGFDVADAAIARAAAPGDLVITADIPLAAEALAKGAQALSPRGERYSNDTIRQLLGMRDFLDTMRSSGVTTGGPPPFGASERNAFANQLDRWIAHRARG